jgi:predicted metal-dependent TIM-barrel fold hydrolase
MDIFDAHLPVDLLEDVDLDNLAYFGLTSAVCIMPVHRSYASSEDLLRSLDEHLREQVPRVEEFQIRARVAAGILPERAPERAIPEYYSRLEQLASRGKIAVIGPLGWSHGEPWEEDIFRRHAEIAKRHDLPIYVRWSRLSERAETAMDRVLSNLSVERASLWYVNVPVEAVRELSIVQRPMVVAVPPSGVDTRELAYWFRSNRGKIPMLLGSSMDVADVDVTALVRTIRELAEQLDEPSSIIEAELKAPEYLGTRRRGAWC